MLLRYAPKISILSGISSDNLTGRSSDIFEILNIFWHSKLALLPRILSELEQLLVYIPTAFLANLLASILTSLVAFHLTYFLAFYLAHVLPSSVTFYVPYLLISLEAVCLYLQTL